MVFLNIILQFTFLPRQLDETGVFQSFPDVLKYFLFHFDKSTITNRLDSANLIDVVKLSKDEF